MCTVYPHQRACKLTVPASKTCTSLMQLTYCRCISSSKQIVPENIPKPLLSSFWLERSKHNLHEQDLIKENHFAMHLSSATFVSHWAPSAPTSNRFFNPRSRRFHKARVTAGLKHRCCENIEYQSMVKAGGGGCQSPHCLFFSKERRTSNPSPTISIGKLKKVHRAMQGQ